MKEILIKSLEMVQKTVGDMNPQGGFKISSSSEKNPGFYLDDVFFDVGTDWIIELAIVLSFTLETTHRYKISEMESDFDELLACTLQSIKAGFDSKSIFSTRENINVVMLYMSLVCDHILSSGTADSPFGKKYSLFCENVFKKFSI